MILQTQQHIIVDRIMNIVLEKPGAYQVELTKPGAEVTISGIFEAEHDQKKSVSVVIHHKAPNTQARTTLKGVGRDQSALKFVGRIIIDPDCGNSHSFLTERILLLSDQATAEAVPDLEILTDDVSCSHAASVSRIPEEQIFYLQSRGISRVAAEDMIVEGFLVQ
ncbi:MAG: SufD family Fe-S cluster assembly protein [Microgenomates group bacterium]